MSEATSSPLNIDLTLVQSGKNGDMRPVLVLWHDATGSDEWQDISEAKDLRTHTISSLGFLVFEDDERIVIAGSWDREREGVSGALAIPKTWLLDMKDIDLDL